MSDEAEKKKPCAPEAPAPDTSEEELEEAQIEQEASAGADVEEVSEPEEAESDEGEPDPITELHQQVGELKEALLRAMAETENTRRRAQREKEEALKYAPGPLAKALLPVADNLRRALESVPEEARKEGSLATMISGVEMTEKELLSAFAKHGIERIEPLGEKLDPNWHEAMFEVPDAEKPAGTVVQVVEAGYRLQDRLLRPARVGVSRKP